MDYFDSPCSPEEAIQHINAVITFLQRNPDCARMVVENRGPFRTWLLCLGVELERVVPRWNRPTNIQSLLGRRVIAELQYQKKPVFGYLQESKDEPNMYEVLSSPFHLEVDSRIVQFSATDIVDIRELPSEEERQLLADCTCKLTENLVADHDAASRCPVHGIV
jgi:hypothetical protein